MSSMFLVKNKMKITQPDRSNGLKPDYEGRNNLHFFAVCGGQFFSFYRQNLLYVIENSFCSVWKCQNLFCSPFSYKPSFLNLTFYNKSLIPHLKPHCIHQDSTLTTLQLPLVLSIFTCFPPSHIHHVKVMFLQRYAIFLNSSEQTINTLPNQNFFTVH